MTSVMTSMGGGGGASAPKRMRIKLRPPGPEVEAEDARHPKMLSLDYSLLEECYPGEQSDLRLARSEGYLQCLNIADACSREAVEEAGRDCIQDVSDYIAGWRFREERRLGGAEGEGALGASDLVPLAIVDAGLQLGDRSSAVEHIKNGLERGGRKGSARCPPVVAVLRSQDCQTVEAALAQITLQCHLKGGTRSRRPLFMDALEEWYNSYSARIALPAAPKKSSEGQEEREEEEGDWEGEDTAAAAAAAAAATGTLAVRRARAAAAARRQVGPVVVLLEDVEGLDKQVLRDLLNVLAQPPSKRVSSIWHKSGAAGTARQGRPVPLAVVAIASARVGFPMDRLSPSAVRQLSPEYFHFPSSLECVELLYEKLFVQGRLPLWMGSRLLSWMKTTFNDFHLSVGMLSRQVKRAASYHFSRPASYLCLHACRPWLRSSSVGNCPADTMNHMKFKLIRDSRMPLEHLNKTLPGLSPHLQRHQAVEVIEQALHREAERALRLWFFHKVWKLLLRSLEERELMVGERRMADAILGRQIATGTGAGVGRPGTNVPGVGRRDRRMAELGSSMRIVGLLLSSKRTKRYYAELKEVSEALAFLTPDDVKGLLRDLLRALPQASPSSTVSAARSSSSTAGSAAAAAAAAAAAVPAPAPAAGAESAAASVALASSPASADQAEAPAPPSTSAGRVNRTNREQAGEDSADQSPRASDNVGHGNDGGGGLDSGEDAGNAPGAINGGAIPPAGAMAAVSTREVPERSSDRSAEIRPESASAPSLQDGQEHGRREKETLGGDKGTPSPVSAPSPTTPHLIQSLEGKEAEYLRRGAGRVMRLWARADQEGWAEPDDEAISVSHLHVYGDVPDAVNGGGTSGGGRGGGKAAGSRGNRLFASALQSSAGTGSTRQSGSGAAGAACAGAAANAAAEAAPAAGASGIAGTSDGSSGNPLQAGADLSGGGGAVSAEIERKREEALRRACLVRELQLLFLHLMGELREVPLGPGMAAPPALTEHASVLAEAYCCDERDRDALSNSLCPLARTNVDLGMMEGACKGSSAVIQKRKEMSREQPVLDICALYAYYRGHGKAIDRSDWFFDFRDEVVKPGSDKNASTAETLAAPEGKGKGRGSRNASSSGRVSARGGCGGDGVGGTADSTGDDGGVDPTGGTELLARFEHASDQLASMGYVRPLKRRRRLEEGKGGKGKKAQGPKGAVTRLVFSYTMEDGAL